jgi:hypothetical protein
MQAVVNAARAQVATEAAEPGRGQPVPPPRQAAEPDAGQEPGSWSDADADFDTSPLPRLTAAGTVAKDAASPALNKISASPDASAKADFAVKPDLAVKPERAAKPRRTLKPRRGAKADRMVKAERTVQPDRTASEPRLVAQAQREPSAPAQHERAAQAERERAARVQRERAAQAERERADAERERAAQAERERLAQAEAERAAQAERERADGERQRAAQAEAERTAQAETERAAQSERAAAAEPAAQAEPKGAPRPDQADSPDQADGSGQADAAAKAGPAAPPGAVEPDAAAQPGQGKWLPEDYFRPLSAVRDPADKKAQWAKRAQEDKDGKKAQWDERIPWDEQEPWHEQPQPEKAKPSHSDVLNASHGHSRRTSTLAATVVAVVIAGSVGLALALRSAPTNSHGQHVTVATIRSQAAAWVAQQVSRDTVVSCDHTMCTAVAQRHFPPGNLHVLDSASSNPAGSTVIIATPTVRSEFGTSLDSELAPVVLASFGSGTARIDVRVIARHGAAAYLRAMHADMLIRKTAGIELLSNPRIHISAAARGQVAAGQVASRLLIVIAIMAARQPVDILAFSNSGPGASPGVPLRSAEVAEVDGIAHPAWTRSMFALLRAQSGTYLPQREGTTQRGGKTVLFIQFAAPSPLGLLGPSGP